ncbi:OmpA family protein [Fulvivirga ulvae]|uniref:OmpA family protein n=1 Tax=Fulvivirga ulvae TaxID=2904245 RepID=UPI001F3F622F|nr:OmpA family protein [Fulvivirga ulvae]UII33169.1 OmpA family protein [Fulvivirga ulvae]
MKIKLHLTGIALLFLTNVIFAFELVQPNLEASIKVETENIKPGQLFKVRVSLAGSMDDKAWLGIFKPNLNQSNASGYYSYNYINAHQNGVLEMTAPPQRGEYELRLYSSDPGKFVSAAKLVVSAITPDEYTITILTEEIKPSQEFKVSVKTTYAMDSRSWIGIFNSTVDPENARQYESYSYVSNPHEATLSLTAPGQAGNYELRFYPAEQGELTARVPFRVGQPDLTGISFTLNKKAYEAGEEITIDYIGHENLAKSAWIGIFENSKNKYNQYLDYQYLNPKLKGQFKLKAPSIKGEYQARMFYAETGPDLLEPVPFSVTTSLDKTTIKVTLDEKGKIALYGIYFNTDKSNVKTESYPLIGEIAKMLNDNPAIKILIEGHTDSQGDDNYNLSLSQKRAEEVAKILTTEYKVSSTQLESKGYGETRPVGDNSTADGRAKNRRVELKKL